MASAHAPLIYTVDDLDDARQRFSTPHVELDAWGNLIVTPASPPHEFGINELRRQVEAALEGAGSGVRLYVDGPPWRVPGGSGYLNVPDITVLAPGTRPAGPDGLHLSPPPLLVVELASPSTRAIDRSRKRADYLLGGATAYWLVDLPGLTSSTEPALTVVQRREGVEEERGPLTGVVDLDVPLTVSLDLPALRWEERWS